MAAFLCLEKEKMKVFKWAVRPNVTDTAAPKVKIIKYGDGYEQRIKDGINNNLRVYNVEFKVPTEEALLIDKFFNHCGGVEPFLWRSPSLNRFIKIKCPKWTNKVDHTVTTISATFEEVVA